MKRLLRFKGEYLSTKDMSCEVEAGLLDMNGCDLVAPILLPPSVFVLALPHACLYDFLSFSVYHVKSAILEFYRLRCTVHKYYLDILDLKDGLG